MVFIPFLTGLYFEYESCIASLLLIGILIKWQCEKRQLIFHWNDSSLAVVILVIAYGLSCFWAIDSGIAVWGFFKYFPLLLFLLLTFQMDDEQKNGILKQIPYTASIMTILSMILALLPFAKPYVLVDNRLGGFFQYPNSFAVYLLIGLIILLYCNDFCEKKETGWYGMLLILLSGIFLTGSRTVMILMVAVGILRVFEILIVRKKSAIQESMVTQRKVTDQGKNTGQQDLTNQKKTEYKKKLSAQKKKAVQSYKKLFENKCMIAIVMLCLLAAVVLSGKNQITVLVSRYQGNPLESSTFLGRLLYVKDAWSQIIKHPFGLGYMGYYLTQGSFQTGVYTVRYVHNDWLQILLDVGWIPGLAVLAVIIKSLFSSRQMKYRKMILLVLFLHGMMDFNMQYLYLFFILILVLEDHSEAESRLSGIWLFPAGLCAIAGIWIGTGNFLYYHGDAEQAVKWYPHNTFAQIVLLEQAETAEDMDFMADQILAGNSHIAVAWNAKARAAYAEGAFDQVMEYMQRAMACQKYDIAIYEDYFEMLETGVALYREAGYEESAEICLDEIKNIQRYLNQVKEHTSDLAWRIRDVPILEMPEEYVEYLEENY